MGVYQRLVKPPASMIRSVEALFAPFEIPVPVGQLFSLLSALSVRKIDEQGAALASASPRFGILAFVVYIGWLPGQTKSPR